MLLVFVCGAAAQSAVLTVDDDRVEFPDALFTDIQSAVDAAVSGDEVLVYPGMYTGTGEQVVDTLGKSITIRSVAGAGDTVIDGEQSRRCLLSSTNAAPQIVIEGFLMRGGSADGGGGVKVSGHAVTFRHCRVEHCRATEAGGGVLLSGSDSAFEWCEISENESDLNGGGMLVLHSDATMHNCVVSSNVSWYFGGGIWSDGCSFDFVDTDLVDNTTAHGGGGIRLSGPFETSTFDGCMFSGNRCEGLWSGGGGVYVYQSMAIFKNCEVSNNFAGGSSGSGGGVLCWESDSALVECDISDNEVTQEGGGVWANDCSPTLTTCDISDNTARFGGGIACKDHAHASLEVCTLSGNQAEEGAAVWCQQFSSPHLTACLVRDNLASAAGGGVYASTNGCNPAAGLTSFCHNLPGHIDGWAWQDFGGNCFEDTCEDVNGDGLPDACQCLPDFNGDQQVAIDDMLQVLDVWGCVACPVEDLNGDGVVNIDDLLAVMSLWGPCPDA